LALIKSLRGFETPQLFELRHQIIAEWREMSCRPRSHPAGNAAAIDNNNRQVAQCEFVSGGNTGYARTNNGHVATLVLKQRFRVRRYVYLHP
jgi:hypothetical protein